VLKWPHAEREYSWSSYRIHGTPAVLGGIVGAPDGETARKKAIEEYEITNPEQQKRPIARRRP
jgi:hypothetical protein